MKNWLRIVLVVFILIGGTMSFGLWSLEQFDIALENLENTSASYASISPFARGILTTATTTPITATSTSSEQATSTATTSEAFLISASSQQDSIDPKFKLVFSPKKSGVYIGCTYKISWLASTTVTSLESALIDGGTREPSGPIASGLASKYEIKPGSQSLDWKVGAVWPGEYYIEISKINSIETEFRSKFFKINKMPAGIDDEERASICRESNDFGLHP